MSELYIGLMSGTSVDGIDVALVDFSKKKPNILDTLYQKYTSELRQEILNLCEPGLNEINRLATLDVKLGQLFATAINTLLKKNALPASAINAIGSHGQTIRHLPASQFTLQIGDPNIIATETGITTIADFRRRDMSYGGQGAPLVPAFHQAIFAKKNTNRAIVNIGGIANITVLSDCGRVSGFDTGPGNILLDAWIEKHLTISYDKNGDWAAKGKIHSALLNKLLDDPYFKLSPPKSTGREYFNLNWLMQYLSSFAAIPIEDVQRTLLELTAISILKSIPFLNGEIFICGGGVKNNFLMQRLQTLGKNLKIHSTEKCHIDPDWIEAIAFAWLAKQTLKKKTGNLPLVTGAKKETILGALYFANNYL